MTFDFWEMSNYLVRETVPRFLHVNYTLFFVFIVFLPSYSIELKSDSDLRAGMKPIVRILFPTTKTKCQVKGWLFVDVTIEKGATIF